MGWTEFMLLAARALGRGAADQVFGGIFGKDKEINIEQLMVRIIDEVARILREAFEKEYVREIRIVQGEISDVLDEYMIVRENKDFLSGREKLQESTILLRRLTNMLLEKNLNSKLNPISFQPWMAATTQRLLVIQQQHYCEKMIQSTNESERQALMDAHSGLFSYVVDDSQTKVKNFWSSAIEAAEKNRTELIFWFPESETYDGIHWIGDDSKRKFVIWNGEDGDYSHSDFQLRPWPPTNLEISITVRSNWFREWWNNSAKQDPYGESIKFFDFHRSRFIEQFMGEGLAQDTIVPYRQAMSVWKQVAESKDLSEPDVNWDTTGSIQWEMYDQNIHAENPFEIG